jgi:hypothetical protein
MWMFGLYAGAFVHSKLLRRSRGGQLLGGAWLSALAACRATHVPAFDYLFTPTPTHIHLQPTNGLTFSHIAHLLQPWVEIST